MMDESRSETNQTGLLELAHKLGALKGLAMLANMRQCVSTIHTMEERCRNWLNSGDAMDPGAVNQMRSNFASFRTTLGGATMDAQDRAEMARLLAECEAILDCTGPSTATSSENKSAMADHSQQSLLYTRIQILKKLTMGLDNPGLAKNIAQAESTVRPWVGQQAAIEQSTCYKLRACLMGIRMLIRKALDDEAPEETGRQMLKAVEQCEESLSTVEKNCIVTRPCEEVLRKLRTLQGMARGLAMLDVADQAYNVERGASGWNAGRVSRDSLNMVNAELWRLRSLLKQKKDTDSKVEYLREIVDETESIILTVEVNA